MKRKNKGLQILIIVILLAAAAFAGACSSDTGSRAAAGIRRKAAELQSSFEYKKYKKPEQYKEALKMRMKRVYAELAASIIDDDSIPIPGLISTYTMSGSETDSSGHFVPQGLCQADRYMLITAYNSKKDRRSVIYAVDTEENRLVSTLTLPNRYHLGGIAFDGSNIWITGNTSDKYEGDPFVQYIKYEDFLRMIAEPVHEVAKSEISGKVAVKNKPSFLECDDGVLWVGSFVGRGSSKKGYMNGYKILQGEDGPCLNTFMYSVITGIDSSAQGADIRGGSLYVSSSYGGAIRSIRSSFVTKYNIAPIKLGETRLNVSGRELKRVEVPKMNEEILVTDSAVLINFESASESWRTAVIATDRILAVSEALWR